VEIWNVEYQMVGGKPSVEFFGTEGQARSFYRNLWKNEDLLQQSVGRRVIPLRILSLKNGGTVPAEWTVRLRVSGHRKPIKIRCGTHDLWNLKRFQRILVEQASVELYDIDLKNYEWRSLLGFFAGKKP
jgi:hypothetical protein